MKIILKLKLKVARLLKLLKKFLVKNKVMLLFLFMLGVLMDMVLLEFVYSFVFFPLMVLWLLCELVYTRKHDWYLMLSIVLLSLVLPLKFLSLETVAEKISIWAYFYLVVAFFKKLKKSGSKIIVD